MVFLCAGLKGFAVCDELNDGMVYHIYSCFMVGILSNAFQYVWWPSILVLVYESKLLAHLDFHLKPLQGMASPL